LPHCFDAKPATVRLKVRALKLVLAVVPVADDLMSYPRRVR
jgi:hypothetical protein